MTVETIVKPPSKPPGNPTDEGRIGILLLEDQAPTRKNLARWLEGEGFFVRRVSRGIEAIREASNPRLQIILLDIKMPGRYNGLDAARVIREKHPAKEILFVTAHSESRELHQRAEEFGLADIKWVTRVSTDQQLQDLLSAVRHAAQKARARQLVDKGKAEGIGCRPLLRCLQEWDPKVTDAMVEELLTEGRPALIAELLNNLSTIRAVCRHSDRDSHLLQMAIGPFKKTVVDRLWDLYEHADLHHRRVALQLELAVRKISSLEFEEEHVDALEFVVKRLAKREISREDVRDCKRILRHQGFDTLLDLGQHRESILESYREEDEAEGNQEEVG